MYLRTMTAESLALLTLTMLLGGCAGGRAELRECAACPEMVIIPAGRFEMGSPASEAERDPDEGPTRVVEFSKPFAIGKFEITREEFAHFIKDTGHEMSNSCRVWDGKALSVAPGKSWVDPGYPVSNKHPVACVSWHDAAAYAAWLSKKTGFRYRLPAEAEWEYATRGGTNSAYAFPDGPASACAYGNVSDKRATAAVPNWNGLACDDGVGFGTAPVGSYLPNGYGLHDTVGNVWEWVLDCYSDTFQSAPTDGSAWGNAGTCGKALDRGGGFSNIFPGHLRAANRSQAPSPNAVVYSLGFRVVRELPTTKQSEK